MWLGIKQPEGNPLEETTISEQAKTTIWENVKGSSAEILSRPDEVAELNALYRDYSNFSMTCAEAKYWN